jgi:cupin superfamily acireductone dioxygenase involved in methionine salvage
MFNTLSIIPFTSEYVHNHPDCLLVHEWHITVEGTGVFYVKNTDMKFYECVDESGETIVSSDSLDGILTHLLEVK